MSKERKSQAWWDIASPADRYAYDFYGDLIQAKLEGDSTEPNWLRLTARMCGHVVDAGGNDGWYHCLIWNGTEWLGGRRYEDNEGYVWVRLLSQYETA